ncbi:ribosomal protection-like ABC-F family protein [Clostridium hydrogenum]|uniref:ribosomal protection-like ABC-F family protein n=1 Tax=Clostridium hydrogenum TaxID=2855764 RepID=UPI001F445195|nr:ABC-F family ATP-binding cassette domain-containing protein [Clostridium hydrogenum]
MFELTVNSIKKYMEGSLILKNISFEVYSGEKVGIVGANGSGKSTILKLIAGVLPFNYWPGYPEASSPGYDEGWIVKPKEATCAYLEQIPEYKDGLKVIDILKLAFEDIYYIENEMHKLEEKMKLLEEGALEKALKQYSDLVQIYEAKGGYEAEEKLSKICTGLKLSSDFLNKDFSLLSGGEKTTVLLGRLLIDDPDILLLDEPTNHLDMDSIEWLEGYLKSYKGIVIVVSHDRYFLDNVVSKIIEIEDKKCISYKGNYSAYIYQKEENLRIQYENFMEQQKKINTMKNTIKNLRDWAMRADNSKFFKRAASIQIKLDKMEKITKPTFEKSNMKLDLKAAQRSGNDTIKVIGLSKRFEDKVIFKDSDLLVKFGERVALIGPNGSGKTTFLKLLLGEEKPDAGLVELGASVIAAYLPQKITFKNEELTVIECFREDISIVEGKAREYLSKFMFYGGSVFKKVRQLSGGEKIRLKLSKLLYENVNLLILDEPTNHLDIESIETFEEALKEFDGTIFFISHDRYFINKIGERIIALEDRKFKSYDGNYDYYKKIKEDLKLQPAKKPAVKQKKIKEQKNTDKIQNNELKTAKAIKSIENLENEIKELDSAMTEDGLSYEKLNELYNRKCELNKELDLAMELWLSLNS